MRSQFISLATLLLLTACASTPEKVGNVAHGEAKPTTVASIEAKQVAAEQQAAYVVEVEFAHKSSSLSVEAKKKMAAFYENIAEPMNLKVAKVISWSDEEYPAKSSSRLNQKQIGLAKQRAENIETFLKAKNSGLQFELYNMAKRAGSFAEFVGGADARIKDSLERAGISTTNEKATSKARKAIVMLVLKERESAK
ncbi:hypothetical protein BH10BDE1_BH10BDE1_26550 [soil metagenome]